MDDIDILLYDYCEAKLRITIIALTTYICSEKYLQNMSNCLQVFHNITRLLLVTIIVISKNYTISIITKGNITVNRQNWLIAHPQCIHIFCLMVSLDHHGTVYMEIFEECKIRGFCSKLTACEI